MMSGMSALSVGRPLSTYRKNKEEEPCQNQE